MCDRLKLKEKRKRAKANYDLKTKSEPMKIPSAMNNGKSLVNLIKTLDKASNKLSLLGDNLSLSQIHRADVFINASNDAWIYSLNPLENLILPLKHEDNQTTCRICES
jgi:hypothetical protein